MARLGKAVRHPRHQCSPATRALLDHLSAVGFAQSPRVIGTDDAECLRWLRYPEPPDRPRRISIFAEAYGLNSADGLVDHVIEVQIGTRDLVARLADEGYPRQVDLVAAGYLDELQARINWSQHRHLIEP